MSELITRTKAKEILYEEFFKFMPHFCSAGSPAQGKSVKESIEEFIDMFYDNIAENIDCEEDWGACNDGDAYAEIGANEVKRQNKAFKEKLLK